MYLHGHLITHDAKQSMPCLPSLTVPRSNLNSEADQDHHSIDNAAYCKASFSVTAQNGNGESDQSLNEDSHILYHQSPQQHGGHCWGLQLQITRPPSTVPAPRLISTGMHQRKTHHCTDHNLGGQKAGNCTNTIHIYKRTIYPRVTMQVTRQHSFIHAGQYYPHLALY